MTASKASSGRSSAVTSRRRSTPARVEVGRDVAQAGQRLRGAGAGTTRARSAAASARRASSCGRRSSSSHCARWRSCAPQRQHSASGAVPVVLEAVEAVVADAGSGRRCRGGGRSRRGRGRRRRRRLTRRGAAARVDAARASTATGACARTPAAKRAAMPARTAVEQRRPSPAAGRSPRRTDVICTPSSPQGTTQPNGARSLSTLIAKPCVVTPRATCTPIEAILRSPAQTPVKSGPVVGPRAGADARVGERRDDRALHRAQVGDDVVDAHDRIADELAGAVVGHARRRGRCRRCRCPARGTRPRPSAARRDPSAGRACRRAGARAAAACRGSRSAWRAARTRSCSASASRYSIAGRWQTQSSSVMAR